MAGLVPGIHVLLSFLRDEDVDGRDKPGHDGRMIVDLPAARSSARAS
jgi:hypothetical protein